jgi:OOP family OmpA-OmpF porin
MKLQFTVLTCALLLSACADQAARARLGIQDPAVLETGFGAAQDAAAGAPDRKWLDTFGPLTNRGSALASLQQRLDGITGDGYFHAKAQCWIAAGRQEFDARDQWGFVEETIGAAAVLTTSLERGAAISAARPPMRTLVTVRPDLWGIVEVVRRDPAFAACQAAQAPLACAEVELMHAGHDAWRRSFDAAEARVKTAQNLLRTSAETTLECAQTRTGTSASVARPRVSDASAASSPARGKDATPLSGAPRAPGFPG